MCLRKLIVSGLVLGSAIIFSGQAFANCNCGPAVWEVNSNLTNQFTGQNQLITTELAKVISAIQMDAAAQKQAANELFEKLKAFFINQEDARNSVNSMRRLSSQGFNHCSGRDVASAAASGAAAASTVRTKSNENTAANGDGTKRSEEEARDGVRRLVATGPLKDEPPLGHDYFPENGLLDSEKTKKLEDAITIATDPRPNPKVADEKTRAGIDAKLEQRVKQARLALAVDTLHALKSDVDAVMSADLLEEYVKTANASHVKVPKDANGMTSMSAFYDILGSKTRILNPNWHQYLMEGVSDEIGVLREIALMQGLQLSIDTQNRDYLKRIAGLLAIVVSMGVEQTNSSVVRRMFAPGVAPVSQDSE